MKKNLLIIGTNSKLAKLFTKTYAESFNFYGTYHDGPFKESDVYNQQYKLDLSKPDEVLDFIKTVQPLEFSGVLFFASTYSQDPTDSSDLLAQMLLDQQINAIAPSVMAKSLNYAPQGRIILFGDSGLNTPKRQAMSYSHSKLLLEQTCKLLAVELMDKATCVCFLLGPTMAPEDISEDNKNAYYSRSLNPTKDIPLGLVHYINFILEDDDLNITGSSIYYDGGTYLRRQEYR